MSQKKLVLPYKILHEELRGFKNAALLIPLVSFQRLIKEKNPLMLIQNRVSLCFFLVHPVLKSIYHLSDLMRELKCLSK